MASTSLQLTNQMFTFQVFVKILNQILSNRASYELGNNMNFPQNKPDSSSSKIKKKKPKRISVKFTLHPKL